MKTEEKDRRHRSQFAQAPASAKSCTNGLTSSTAMTAQIVMTNRSNKTDQKRILKQLPIIWMSRRNSLRTEKSLKTRNNRSNLPSRTTRMMPKPTKPGPNHCKEYSTTPKMTMPISMRFHKLLRRWACSTKMRISSSTTNVKKQASIMDETQEGGGPPLDLPGYSAWLSVSKQINPKLSKMTIAQNVSVQLLCKRSRATFRI
mmetsp:Transcript_78355/g.254583  ORF Transcript_78355/g.254583 Transcript_78355/m.254583 type:complete len:202 (-) Transcript_78355:466-1071(-)